jgi:hypothetical protein
LAVPGCRKKSKKRSDKANGRWRVNIPLKIRENDPFHSLEGLDGKHAAAQFHVCFNSEFSGSSLHPIRFPMKFDGKVERSDSNKLKFLWWDTRLGGLCSMSNHSVQVIERDEYYLTVKSIVVRDHKCPFTNLSAPVFIDMFVAWLEVLVNTEVIKARRILGALLLQHYGNVVNDDLVDFP